MTSEIPEGNNPNPLEGLFDDHIAEHIANEIEDAEWHAERLRVKVLIRDAFLETGDAQLGVLAGIIDLDTDDELVETFLARAVNGEYPDTLREAMLPALDMYRHLVDDLAGYLAFGAVSGEKPEAQLAVIENGYLSPDAKEAALSVIDKLLPGKGLDTSDPDAVAAMQRDKEIDNEREDYQRMARGLVRSLIDEQTDFLEAHSIHENDPAWRSLRGMISHLLIAEPVVVGALGASFASRVTECLQQLHLTRDEYEAFYARIRDLLP